MTPRTPAACGTISGYQAHRRRGETPCDDCKGAIRDYYAAKRAKARAAAPPKPPPPPKPPKARRPRPAKVVVRWLLPPPGGSTPLTEYARIGRGGAIHPISPDQARELLDDGHERVYVRTVSLWTRIAADPAAGPGWWRTTADGEAS